MKKNSERLDHALHNEQVCDYLQVNEKSCFDWIITTAFYTAYHFVAYKVFPFQVPSLEGKQTTINTVDEYHNYKKAIQRNISKHELLADLVEKNCPEISPDYDWLLDMSMKARYYYYYQDKDIAGKAVGLMKVIKKYCTKEDKKS